MTSFNTSYVSVQETSLDWYDKSEASFNTSYVSVQADILRYKRGLITFQYILCVGSS